METRTEVGIVEAIQKLVRGNIRQYGMIIALVFIIVLFQIITGPTLGFSDGILLQPMNITNLIMQTGFIHIMAIGMMLVIITGGIDLSIGSVVAATGAISAILMIRNDVPVMLAIPLVLLLGILIGSWHGFFVSVVNMPAFIATLAGMMMFRGVCQVILNGETIARYPAAFLTMSTGFLSKENGEFYLEVMGKDFLSLALGAVIILLIIFFEFSDRRSKQKYNLEVTPLFLCITKLVVISLVVWWLADRLASYNGVPVILCIVVGLVIFYTFIMKNTILGRHIYAVGGNQVAARLSGINVGKIKFFAYANMGMLAALAGMIAAGRLNAATPRAGVGYELDAIAACFIGGASTSGGIGTIVGGITGAMVIGVLNNGMSILGVSVDWQNIIKGLVLIIAVCFDIYAKKRSVAA